VELISSQKTRWRKNGVRIKLIFSSVDGSKILLRRGYFSPIQGLIYNLLDEVSKNWLHEEGFRYQKRFFKLFVFSEIMEKGVLSRSKNEFLFPRKISIFVASPVNWILEQVVKNGIMEEYLTLGENKVRLIEVETGKDPDISEGKVEIRTLNISIHPDSSSKFSIRRIVVKDTSVNGWKGRFYLEGDIPLMKFAFNVGLGSHNSLGFGFIEKVERRRK